MIFIVRKKTVVSHLTTLVEVKSCAVALALLESASVEVSSFVIDYDLYLVLTGALRGKSRAQLGVMVSHPLIEVVCPCPHDQKLAAVAVLVAYDFF